MEIQFQKNTISYLQTLLRQQQKQEQTQQIRLSDAMPDIGRVLGCWGQILIRGKEWHRGSVGVSGGVMAWVLYQPEGDPEPCCVDAWIPFQMKWDTDETDRDGIMEVTTTLCHMDARMLSDRKLMVRANIGAQMHAMIVENTMLHMPGELPEDIQVLQQTYPMLLPLEASEKQFDIEQQLEVPSDRARIQKLIRFSAQPVLTEYKIIADKLILRGNAEVYVLYLDEQGKVQQNTWQVPFSQYTQLDTEYAPGAEVSVCFELTQLELEVAQPDTLELKLGFTAQYIVLYQQNVTATMDMYSPVREVKMNEEQHCLPAVLQMKTQTMRGEAATPEGRIRDVEVYLELPQTERNEDVVDTKLEGQFQILYEDSEGNLQTTVERWEKVVSNTVAADADYQIKARPFGTPEWDMGVGMDLQLEEKTVATTPMRMVIGAETGEAITLDPLRPSIILRRAGAESLWEIAKSTGSTVDAIRKANGMQQEPSENQILLIPVK